ncbi:hypothetical protein Cni_G17855 [Canna indica]|uniref:Uncharacterized protein n=1 Tax=Canna indica TaxID=4628 RepID=A0AAQ3KI71_9LILI|nr:hypothetical protein Cni_G17855 [Canna indica]
MGCNHSLGFITSLLFFLLILSLPRLCVSISDDRGANARSPFVLDRYHQGGFHVMKPRPWPSSPSDDRDDHLKRKRRRRRRKIARGYSLGTRSNAFSAMLPRGFVPPSDSSWCHNDTPESVQLFCEEKSTSRP